MTWTGQLTRSLAPTLVGFASPSATLPPQACDLAVLACSECVGALTPQLHPSSASRPPQVCDLASLAAIRALAEEWLAGGAPLDLLINK